MGNVDEGSLVLLSRLKILFTEDLFFCLDLGSKSLPFFFSKSSKFIGLQAILLRSLLGVPSSVTCRRGRDTTNHRILDLKDDVKRKDW